MQSKSKRHRHQWTTTGILANLQTDVRPTLRHDESGISSLRPRFGRIGHMAACGYIYILQLLSGLEMMDPRWMLQC